LFLIEGRAELAGVVEHAEALLEPDGLDVAVAVPVDLHRADRVEATDPFLITLEDLGVVCRHLVEALEGGEGDGGHPGLPQRRARHVDADLAHDGAGDVVGDVAAADNNDVVAQLLGQVAQRNIPQELYAAQHAGALQARQGERPRVLGAHRDDHRIVIGDDLIEADVDADAGVAVELDPQGADHVDLGADQIAWQPVLGDAVDQHASGLFLSVEDDRPDAQQCQVVGAGQTRRTGADDRHLASIVRETVCLDPFEVGKQGS
jgi:hypothetical protein